MDHIPAGMLIPCGQHIQVLIAESLSLGTMGMTTHDNIMTLLEVLPDGILRKLETSRLLGMDYLFAFKNKLFCKIVFNRARQNFIEHAV